MARDCDVKCRFYLLCLFSFIFVVFSLHFIFLAPSLKHPVIHARICGFKMGGSKLENIHTHTPSHVHSSYTDTNKTFYRFAFLCMQSSSQVKLHIRTISVQFTHIQTQHLVYLPIHSSFVISFYIPLHLFSSLPTFRHLFNVYIRQRVVVGLTYFVTPV